MLCFVCAGVGPSQLGLGAPQTPPHPAGPAEVAAQETRVRSGQCVETNRARVLNFHPTSLKHILTLNRKCAMETAFFARLRLDTFTSVK